LPEFDQEMANTRRTLERVPEDKLSWKPHQKSPTMGWLASHLAHIPSWVRFTFEQDSLDVEPGGQRPAPRPLPATLAEVLSDFDQNVAQAREILRAAADSSFAQPWTLLKNGRAIFTLPRAAVIRSFVLNHLIHHRAQLTVYLRLNDVPVPALYGPSADESPF
jgi:uncharacterized damage-inducible protein DinB